ncbi:MAG: hypothetical protein ACXWVQ_11225 [Methyloceanibacter sp.]
MPFGGALIYVPVDWVKPAEGGVERLLNVYVSMGVTPPVSVPAAGGPPIIEARVARAVAKPKGAKPSKPD